MKENERQLVVDRIKKDIDARNALILKKERLNALLKEPSVLEYIDLLQEISRISNDQAFFEDKLEKNIYLEFVWAFQSRIKGENLEPCNHDIWIYNASYVSVIDERNNEEDYISVKSEKNTNFRFNEYICLECGSVLRTPDWVDFEKNNFVLKNQSIDNEYNVEYYINLYYQSLFYNSVEDSKKIVIDEFNKNIEECNKKVLKK